MRRVKFKFKSNNNNNNKIRLLTTVTATMTTTTVTLVLILLTCYYPRISSASNSEPQSATTSTNAIASIATTSNYNNNNNENDSNNIVFNKKFSEPILTTDTEIETGAAITNESDVKDSSFSINFNNNNNDNSNNSNGNSQNSNVNDENTLNGNTYSPPSTFTSVTTFNKTFTSIGRITTPEEYAKSVIFRYYKDGQLTYIADGINTENLDETGCNANDKFAFILHGWKQNCDVEWVPLLISKLTQYRGGCVICIDYGYFAQEPYVRLVRQYEPLSDLITEKLRYLRNHGFNPDKGYMFGFSYGGQLACAVGRKLGTRLIKEIDTCDMAGPGFDYKVNRLDHRDAAQNVQCIHTTRDKGTKYYTCHQDWRMGNCGFSQPAAKDPPKGSHGLCPYFYINAFEYAFYAVKRPDKCLSKKPATYWPNGFKMGYMESRKNAVNGELFAYTGEQYPFNVAITSNNNNTTISNNNNNILHNNYPSYNPQLLQQYPLTQTQLLFYGTPQIPKFRDRPVLNSIMRARKFLKRLQRNLRKRYSNYS